MQVTEMLAANEPAPSGVPHGAGIAEFWRNRGERVFEAGGVYWGHYSSAVYISLPFHLQLAPGAGEMDSVLRANRIACVRFPSKAVPGRPAAMMVCDPRGYGLDKVKRKQRAQVEEGLERCIAAPLDPDRLEREGLELNLDTMARQNRHDAEFGDPRRWKQLVDAIRRSAAISVTGVFFEGRLAAYMVNCIEDGWLHAMYKMSLSAFHEHHVNHVLDYSVLLDASRNPAVRMVGNWYASDDPQSGLDRYKRSFGYTPSPVNLTVVLHPAIAKLATGRTAQFALNAAKRIRPGSEKLRKAGDLIHAAQMSAAESSPAQPDTCQQEEALTFSRPWRPHAVFLAWWYSRQVRKRGISGSAQFAYEKVAAQLSRDKKPVNRRPIAPDEVLGLQPGEWVEIKAEQEVSATLDKRGKNRGLLFTNEMRPYYGRRFRVVKRVERIFLEESRQNRKLKNTVILEGVHCSGAELECDRNCFLFWKEVWLRRSDPPPGWVSWQGTQVQLFNVPAGGGAKSGCGCPHDPEEIAQS